MSRPLRPCSSSLLFLPVCLATIAHSGAQTLYQFGNPTADEQMYIEQINRARANPPAEGARLAATTDPQILALYSYYGVDLNLMKSEFNAIEAAPPLAPNASLTTAARGHSQWMFNNATQSHEQTNPYNDTEQRITDAGYNWWTFGENVYSYAYNAVFGHAGFQVDWGPGPGGMQDPRGHRDSIHYADFREIGVGVVNGTNGGVGPQLVTQDFGEPFDTVSFGTGVAYYDLNSNNFYDIGEGISGLTVNIAGGSRYCTTATGGGWAFPIPDNAATRVVTFSGLGVQETKNLVIPDGLNAKVDLKLAYTPPAITSAGTAAPDEPHTVTFTAVGGATAYRLNRWNAAPATNENCESLAGVTVSTTGSYQVLNTAVKQQESASFHLVIPAAAASNQIVELKTAFHGGTSPSLSFQSLLRTSTSSQQHRVQVKPEGSSVWQDVYSQAGGTAEPGFSLKSVNLSSMAGKIFRVRFILSFTTGSTYTNTGDNYGWFIDAISFGNLTALSNNVSQTLTGTSGTITPAAGNYMLTVSPVISGIDFPAGSQSLTVSAPPSGYITWAASAETAAGLPAGTIANDPDGDHDSDGLANLVEYAFGTSPVTAGEISGRLPAIQASSSHLVVRYVRDPGLGDLTVTPVASADFSTWLTPGAQGAPAGFTDAPVSTDGDLETREARIPITSGTPWFLRMKITRP